MKSKAVILVATLAFAFAFVGCSDSVVGTDDEATNPLLKKGGNKPPPDADDPADFRSVTVTFENGDGYLIESDGRGAYVDGNCGVWANIGNFDDARLDPDREYKGKKLARTCGDARALVFEFPDWRGTKTVGAFMNVDGLDAMTTPEVGGPPVTMETTALFHVCNTLLFGRVLAERTSLTTWTVTTEGASADATCADGSVYSMPFTLTITE